MTASSEHRLADGRRVCLRPFGGADIDAIARLYRELSPDSFWRRFQFRATRPGPALTARLAGIGAGEPGSARIVAVRLDRSDDQARDQGRAAQQKDSQERGGGQDRGEVFGEGRYVRLDDETAEMALVVRDDLQGAGLGRLMLARLVELAAADGLLRLRADVLNGNDPAQRLLSRYGCAEVPTADAAGSCLEISAIGGMPGWPSRPAGVTARRVLVERGGRVGDKIIAALRAAGDEVRQCSGPLRAHGARCALAADGECRLAAGADLIVCLLPPAAPACAPVLATHRHRWPHKLAEPR